MKITQSLSRLLLVSLALLPMSVLPEAGAADSNSFDMPKLLSPWKEKIVATERDVILINLTAGADSLFASKVGGLAYLPPGGTLPTDERGKKMFLLAQLNFEEIPKLKGYPEKGILQFFIASDDHYGANFDGPMSEESLARQTNYRIVYYLSVDQKNGASDPSSLEGAQGLPFNPKKPMRMTFQKSRELINSQDVGFEKVFGLPFLEFAAKLAKENHIDEEEFSDALSEYLGKNDFVHKIGGYPSFTQEDPRSSDSSKLLFLQLGSENTKDKHIMWGDAGIAGFFIDPKALEQRDFKHVMYTWDCS